ncbi:hypothetical protein [Clostridium thermarum]|uniref:hypothetical protein n=1 Tax=Clostridium thermarum TaxID=1716543 RepID=UPI0013D6E605|nr:hypothetical protein [Clostridium thermarum]
MSHELAVASKNISSSVEEVNNVLSAVTSVTQGAVISTEEILYSLEQTSAAVNELTQQAQGTTDLAERIAGIVRNFKI